MVGGANVEESVLEGPTDPPERRGLRLLRRDQARPSPSPASQVLGHPPCMSERASAASSWSAARLDQGQVARVTTHGEGNTAWEELPPGEVGELLITGPNVSRGTGTREIRRAQDPGRPRLLARMGDLAYRDEAATYIFADAGTGSVRRASSTRRRWSGCFQPTRGYSGRR
jgi:acyl-CoA synthetase (AMP-forming)/AMP-acid ligase II